MPDAPDRRTITEDALVREPSDDGMAGVTLTRLPMQSPAEELDQTIPHPGIELLCVDHQLFVGEGGGGTVAAPLQQDAVTEYCTAPFFKTTGSRLWFSASVRGQELSEHTAAQPARLSLVQGVASVNLGEDTQKKQSGTWVQMPASLKHSVLAMPPLVMLSGCRAVGRLK